MQHLKVDAEDIREKFGKEIVMIKDGALQHVGFLQSIDSKRHMDSEGLSYVLKLGSKVSC